MPTQRVQFTEWLPDQPDNAGGLNDALNVIPVSIGYQPFPNAVDFSGAAAEDINSVFVGKWGTEIIIFAGGATKLFKFNNTTEALEDKSKSGGYSSTFSWKFVQFGKTVIAVNGNAILQYWTIGTSTAWADIATSPVARQVAVVRDFVREVLRRDCRKRVCGRWRIQYTRPKTSFNLAFFTLFIIFGPF